MLIKRSEGRAAKGRLANAYAGLSSGGLDRRTFLRQAGFAGAGPLSAGSAHPARRPRAARWA
jgi:formate dehydrogenase major subunit